MENKLRQLYALQLIDSNLDELEEMRGDLPAGIRALEEKHKQVQDHISGLEQTMRSSFAARDTADSDIIGLREKLERYKVQQYEVRTNKQYDALTKEMDLATDTIAKLEREMEVLEGTATNARNDIEVARKQLDELDAVLNEKRQALAEVMRATEAEELRYTNDRQNLVARINKSDLAAYERIRKAKKGKAVVPVKRGACGGCFNRVPPQKMLELRQNNRIFMCERCGRILVSDEIVETSSTAV